MLWRYYVAIHIFWPLSLDTSVSQSLSPPLTSPNTNASVVSPVVGDKADYCIVYLWLTQQTTDKAKRLISNVKRRVIGSCYMH